ncbi:MAG: peptidoglycan-binding domain-containing protein, partial [Flavitalea sp.]
MIKEHFKKELTLSAPVGVNSGSSKKDVIRVQSWIVLHEMARPGSSSIIGIDGDFGSATELAVKNFQKKHQLRGSGVVGTKTFELLCEPLLHAFSYQPSSANL